MKSLDLAFNWINSCAILGQGSCFILIFLCIALDFNFESYFESISISVFHDFIFQNFISCSFDDFSVNLDPNPVIFDFVDLSLNLLSKNIKIPNFYLHFIVRFH